MAEQADRNDKQSEGRSAPGAAALLVSGSPAGVDPGLLRSLAAQASFVLAVDSGAEHVVEAGLIPDLLIGDLDSLSKETLTTLQEKGVPVKSYDPYKNATDVELALEFLSAEGYRHVVVTNVLGGRTDHALGALGALAGAAYDKGLEVTVRDNHEACYFVACNAQDSVLELGFAPAAPLPHPEQVSLIAWGGPATVSIQGMEWPLDHHRLSPYSALGVSNELRSSMLRLEVHEGNGTVLLLLTWPH